MTKFLQRALLALLLLATCLVGAQAAPMVKADHVKLDIALETPATPGAIVWVAIRQTVESGWHTYWRNPGDSGLATSIAWQLPKGVSAGAIQWPVPEKFVTGPIVNYGYAGTATLLVPLHVARDAIIGTAPAQAKLFLLECAKMCIPEQVTLDVDLRSVSGNASLFAAARAALPRIFAGTTHVQFDAHTLALTLHSGLLAGANPAALKFFPATAGAMDYDTPPHVRITGDTLVLTMSRPKHIKAFQTFSGVVQIPGRGAFGVSARTGPPQRMPPPARTEALGLIGAVALALLGGLILNLMPCVLPILSMKALAIAQSGESERDMRRDGIFYFAGVLASFAVIAGILLALKASGAALGWGFQLQSPYVVLALALLMIAIGMNLLGIFEVPLNLAGAGESWTRGHGSLGVFFTGVLAVLVASPCTAPFMGAAVGYALTQSTLAATFVFLALGVGFALPLTAIAFTPAVIRLVPKPGMWMVRFKQALAFPMFATAIWLLWVLGQQAGTTAIAIALTIALEFVFLLWLIPLFGSRTRKIVALAGGAALIALSLNVRPAADTSNLQWQPWSVQAVADARHARKPVLVDFGAAWCVTCLINESTVLDNDTVLARLRHDGVVTLKADWTSRNPAITEALKQHGRGGVPLYLLYPPDPNMPATVLPQLLTPSLVLAAIDHVESGAAQRAD